MQEDGLKCLLCLFSWRIQGCVIHKLAGQALIRDYENDILHDNKSTMMKKSLII
jgi:hypothetical protein